MAFLHFISTAIIIFFACSALLVSLVCGMNAVSLVDIVAGRGILLIGFFVLQLFSIVEDTYCLVTKI